MLRKSFRIGLTAGVLVGLALAVSRMLRSRSGAGGDPAPPRAWSPLPDAGPPVSDAARPVGSAAATPPPPAATAEATSTHAAASDAGPAAGGARTAPATASTPTGKAPAKKAPAGKKTPAKKASAGKKAPGPGGSTDGTSARGQTEAFVDPDGGVCPTSHPVKAKLSSRIFHLPGMLNYERTKPDRCYLDAASAEQDGFRASKR